MSRVNLDELTLYNRMRKVWMTYVCLNHHKQKDCEFTIISGHCFYDDNPCYTASHRGYIIEHAVVFPGADEYVTSGNDAAIGILRNMMVSQKRWCDEVMSNPKDYDEEQNKQAAMYKTDFLPLIEEAQAFLKNRIKRL